MQHGVTLNRDYRLSAAADRVERNGATLGRCLREARLQTSTVVDEMHARELGLVLDDEYAAEYYARRVTVARLAVPQDTGAYEWIIESYDEVLHALREVTPELQSLTVVEMPEDELPSADPDGPVTPCALDGLWYRSQSERRIAQALEEANVLFAPNASVRLGVTADHRSTMEPDFLVWVDRKLGVLEVDGPWHDGRAADDHQRDESLMQHGVRVVRRYPADECYGMPGDVVARFLGLLRLNG